jgi:hypothetical protein
LRIHQTGDQVNIKQMTNMKDYKIHLYWEAEVLNGKKETKMGFADITGIRWIMS